MQCELYYQSKNREKKGKYNTSKFCQSLNFEAGMRLLLKHRKSLLIPQNITLAGSDSGMWEIWTQFF